MSNSSQSINEVVSDLVHDVDVCQHLVQRQHLPTEYSTCTVPLLALSALRVRTVINTRINTMFYANVNPLDSEGNYSATSNNTKLVRWPLMGGLLRLVQRGGAWAGCGPIQSSFRCTKCNSPPMNGQCTDHFVAIMMVRCSAVLMWRLKG